MSASALRYQCAPDRNHELRDRIIALAQRHRRYGAGMIYLKLRQAGLVVNHKRVDRLYAEAALQVKPRKRKKIPVGERQPLFRPAHADQVWSMDFVFDCSADGRVIKCWTILDDATHEAIAIIPERTIGGEMLTRIMDKSLPAASLSTSDKDRQWQGVLWQGHAELVPCQWCATQADRTW